MTKGFSQRVDIRLGYRCNARCSFCYYLDAVDTPVEKEPSTEQIFSRLQLMRREGATEVEFTGGEPTIRRDIVEIVSHARELGFVNISFITNGLRLSKPEFAARLIQAGANDFLFSIHGHTPSLHDQLTKVPGSYSKVLQAVENVATHGARYRSSTTVNGVNFVHTPDMVHKFIELGVSCIHLAVFSPVADAETANKDMFVRYSDAAHYIKKAIDEHKHELPPLSVKYIPFCFMKGYEKYVMNLYQQNFDPDDWNYYLSQRVRHGDKLFFSRFVGAAGIVGGLALKEYSFPRRYGWYGIKAFGVTRLVELLRKKRPKACRSCSYDFVCDHVWKDYVKEFGESEISPILGPKVLDPAWCYEMSVTREAGSKVSIPIAPELPTGRS